MKNNLQVFIISGKDPLKNLGGLASYAYNLAKVLSQNMAKEKIHLVCISEDDKTEVKQADFCYVHHVKSYFKKFAMPLLPLHSFFLARHIRSYIKEIKTNDRILVFGLGQWGLVGAYLEDLVISISAYFTTLEHEERKLWEGIIIADYGILMKIKYAFIYFIFAKSLSFFERRGIRGNDYILVHYQSTKNILKQEIGLPEDRFIFSPYYSVEAVKKEEVPESLKDNSSLFEKPLVLTICRQEARKGINYLLRAIKQVVEQYQKKANFVFIGSGDLLGAHVKLARKLGIERFVHFLGFVRDIEPYLEQGDIFILPSIEEGSSAISLQEAMQYQLAIITTDCDGMPEDITDGVSGLLVPPADSKSLAQAIIQLLNSPESAKQMGRAAQRVYQEKFTPDKMKITWQAILKKI